MAGNNSGDWSTTHTVASIIVLGFVVVIALVKMIRRLCSRHEQLHDQGSSPSAGGGADPRARQPPAAVAVEVRAGPVVCAYRRADGWREATCPVCLSDFADGEAVSVLPACMHYFHAACVGEWLRVRATCPLCRAAPAAAIV